MKKKRFAVEQIVAILKQAELGIPIAGADPAGRHFRADVLSMEEEVHGAGGRSGTTVEANGRRKHTVEAHCGRFDAGQGHAAGRAHKKI